jgi:hypothetical protein
MTPPCTLHVISGPAAGQEFEVDRELIIGRRDADLAIADDELSRRHAAVRPAEQGVVVEDLGSLNGTFVDGERIQGAVTLTADATVRVGRSEMSLRLAAVEAPQPDAQEPEAAGDAGRTRLASTLPPEPDAAAPAAPEPEPRPIPQPQVTRVRAVPGIESPEPETPAAPEPQAPAALEPIPQPQVTRVRAVPGTEPPEPQAPAAPEPIPQPQVTRVRAVPNTEPPPPEPQPPAAIPEPQVTRVRAVAEPGAGADGDEKQAKGPGLFKRLLARLRGRGAGPGEADG